MSLLEVKNLRTYFHTRAGTTRAVDDVSFSINKGEIVGVVGESGSGKSVTCHTMLGLLPSPPAKVEGGAVTFDNQVRNQMSSLVAALQPALIIFLAIAVGGITITMLSAVFSMNAVEF